MVQHVVADPTYVLGRSDAEARRLMLQSRLFHRISRRFLADAGIAPGMTVLNVGSRAGDVAFAAVAMTRRRQAGHGSPHWSDVWRDGCLHRVTPVTRRN